VNSSARSNTRRFSSRKPAILFKIPGIEGAKDSDIEAIQQAMQVALPKQSITPNQLQPQPGPQTSNEQFGNDLATREPNPQTQGQATEKQRKYLAEREGFEPSKGF
jgi:hypothetical protein